MALWPGPDSAFLYVDPNNGLTSLNQWIDSSRGGCHITPNANYAAPNYGLATGPSGAKRIAFNRVNQYGTLPLRFYTLPNLPTTAMTVAIVAQYSTASVVNDRIFSCVNAGQTRGFELLLQGASDRLGFTLYDAAGVASQSADTANVPLVGRTRVSVRVINKLSLSGQSWHDRVQTGAWWAGGNVNPIGYDTAVVPTLGAFPTGAVPMGSNLYFIGGWNFAWTHSEAVAFSDYWRDRT